MRVTARVPARNGRVAAVTVQVRCEGLPDGVAVDVTDVLLQPGDPTGTVPHPGDVSVRPGGRQYRNGVVVRSDTIIAMSNSDQATPARVTARANADVRVGSFRFGRVRGTALVDGEAGTATQGWGRAPIITERSDLQARVTVSAPTHITVDWADRT